MTMFILYIALGLLSRMIEGLDTRPGTGFSSAPRAKRESQQFPLCLFQERRPWFGRKESLATTTGHKNYLRFKSDHKYWMRCNLFYFLELQSVIENLGLDKSLQLCFEFARPCVLLPGWDFWSFFLLGNSEELAVTSRGLRIIGYVLQHIFLKRSHYRSLHSWLLRSR